MGKYVKYVLVVLVVLAVGIFLYWRTNSAQLPEGQTVSYDLIDRGNYGLYSKMLAEVDEDEASKMSVVVIDNIADWRRFWGESIRESGTGGFEGVPEVDFEDNIVIGVLQGVKPTSGYYLNTDGVVTDKDGLVLNMNVVEPENNEGLAQVISSPYEVISVAKIDSVDYSRLKVKIVNVLNGEEVFSDSYQNLTK